MDEPDVKVRSVWTYLYRAVDSLGQTIDFLHSARRNATAAKCFFRKALRQPHTVNPRTITVDRNPACPRAVRDLKRAGRLWRFSRLPQRKYLNNVVEQDHRRIKRLVRPGLDFGSLRTAGESLAGFEAMAVVGKGQVHNVDGRHMKAQAAFVAGLFGVATSVDRTQPPITTRPGVCSRTMMEKLVSDWLYAPSSAEAERLFHTVDSLALREMQTVPLGICFPRTAYPSDLKACSVAPSAVRRTFGGPDRTRRQQDRPCQHRSIDFIHNAPLTIWLAASNNGVLTARKPSLERIWSASPLHLSSTPSAQQRRR